MRDASDAEPSGAVVRVVLVHSPFLGPGSLRPLADSLAGTGWPAYVPDLRSGLRTTPVHGGLVAVFAAETVARVE